MNNKAKSTRLNSEIRAPYVRLIGEEGESFGVIARHEALLRASDVGLDLVEISPNTDPPVCKIMDYGKYLFQLNKKQSASKKKQKRVQVKELRIRPGIGEGDYQVKLRNLIRFLEEGDKVEIHLRFRGREMQHKDIGMQILTRIQNEIKEYGDVEQMPKSEGTQMVMVVVPKKTK